MRSGVSRTVLLTASLVISACGGSDGTGPQPGTPVLYVAVYTPVGGILPGQSATFAAFAFDSALAEIPDAEFDWSSSDPAIARVSSSGVVTGVTPGVVWITVRSGGKEDQTGFLILDPVAEIGIAVPLQPVVPLASFRIQPDLRSADGGELTTTDRHLEWSSSSPGVATVTSDGQVAAVAPGSARITLRARDEGVEASVDVSVARVTFRTFQYTGGWGGPSFACAVTIQGGLYCMGIQFPDQLYTADYMHGVSGAPVPTAVAPGLELDSLTVGAGHACGLTPVGAAWCWGDNATGALGNGSTVSSWAPVQVSGGLVFRALRAGNGYSCGIVDGGAAYCWGTNERGQFGDGSTNSSTVPVPAVAGIALETISLSPGIVSAGGPTCGMTTSGVAYCWGANELGQAGNGSRSPDPAAPGAVQSPLPLVAVAAGGEHACGLSGDGTALCWGNGFNGELGRPVDYPGIDSVAGPVQGAPTFVKLAAGLHRTCGLTPAGEAWCWGADWGMTPVPVASPEPFADLHVTGHTSCGISISSVAYCWETPDTPPRKQLGQ